MTQEEIRKRAFDLVWKRSRLWKALETLQMSCRHPGAKREARSNVGHYDPSADKYWWEIDCPDCGKHWTEPQ